MDGKMKKFSDLSREVDEDLEKKIQQIYDTYGEIDEALIKRLNLQGLIKRAKQAGIRMKKLMRNPAHRAKIERKKKKQKTTPELLVKAEKQARNKIRSKFFPKYKEMGRAAKAKIDQVISVKHGAKISKIAKRLLPKVKVQARQDVKRARELATSDPDA